MPNRTPLISVVSPMHNEELCAEVFVSRVHKALDLYGETYEVIVVNDGSTDRTESLLKSQLPIHKNLRIINLSKNSGQWAAIYAGMQESRGKYVVIMDSDLQHLPEEIPLLIDKIKEGFALVSGARSKRKESFLSRRLPSLIANFLLRKITHCPAKDMGGFKCLNGTIARRLHLRAGQHRFLPALVWQMGGQIAEIPITAEKRFAGKSHYGIARSLDVLFDIALLWLNGSFKQRQLYLFGNVSLSFFFISFLMFSWVSFQKLVFGTSLTNRPAFFISLFGFFASFGIMTFGFILEILTNIQAQVIQSKPYHIREISEFKSDVTL